MARRLGFIAVCGCLATVIGCDGAKGITPGPTPASPAPNTMVTVEFAGRVVDADAGRPVADVRVSVSGLASRGAGLSQAEAYASEIATSGGDGAFTLPLNLPTDWKMVALRFTGPAGYDDTQGRFEPMAAPCGISPCWAAADRPAIRIYPTLVIRAGESIKVRVTDDIFLCGSPWWPPDAAPCRRVLVEGSPGEPVALEIVPDDTSKPMALLPESLELDSSVRRVVVRPGSFAYVWANFWGGGTATLTAQR